MDKREAWFDGWVVDFDSGEISRDGNTHRLQDQPLQILATLLQHPGEVVTREQLISRLWPTGVVEFDTGLNSAIRKLRIALGDDAETPRYIETLPRKGYRFIGRLDPPPPTAATRPLPVQFIPTPYETGDVIGRRASDRRAPIRRLVLGFGSLLVALALGIAAWNMPAGWYPFGKGAEEYPTLVVLPLVDMSMDQKEQALCDGLTDELSNWLAHIPTLRVVARTSAFAFKGKPTDVRAIGAALNATHVLEGSLRRSGDQLRITVQLIKADSGLHMWSRSFDMPMGDIFLIEDTVSRSVAEALHLELSADQAERWAQRTSEKPESYEYYLMGRARLHRRTAEDNLKAIEYFRSAVDADPGYSLGLIGLSEALLNGVALNRTPLEDVTAEVEPLINRALALSPKLPDAYADKGWLLTEQFKFDEALPYLQRAIQLNPSDAASHRFLGNFYDRRAEPNHAIEHYSIAASLDPMDFISHVFRCIELADLGQFEEAGAACARAREIEPSAMWGPLASGWLARAQGKTEEALGWIDAAHQLAPNDAQLVDQKIELLQTLGRHAEARAAMNTMPADDGFFAEARDANLVYAEGGATALKEWLAKHALDKKAGTGAEMAELARLELISNDAVAARAILEHADRILPQTNDDLYDGSQIRHGYSWALIRAMIEMRGGGDPRRAKELLAGLDRLLATYEKNGGTHFGLYALRAESLAMQGKKAEAAAALRTAWERGWRAVWLAKAEPYLEGVELPGAKSE